jgi:hypothetical protein
MKLNGEKKKRQIQLKFSDKNMISNSRVYFQSEKRIRMTCCIFFCSEHDIPYL